MTTTTTTRPYARPYATGSIEDFGTTWGLGNRHLSLHKIKRFLKTIGSIEDYTGSLDDYLTELLEYRIIEPCENYIDRDYLKH